MSADPFANTTTVKNILQHIISPKIVSDGSGGYVTKTDLVNVDHLILNQTEGTGTSIDPLTGQVGVYTLTTTAGSTQLFHKDVKPTSIVFAQANNVNNGGTGFYVFSVKPANGSFTVWHKSTVIGGFSWFIASF